MKYLERRKGFTLIELLVVISIIAFLSSVVLASLNSARNKARLSAGMRFALSTHNILGSETIGIWSFEESAVTATDSSGNGNNGTMSGVNWATNTYAPISAHSIALDSLDYVHVPHNDNQFMTGGFTISAWVNPTSSGGGSNGRIVDKTGGGTGASGGFHYFITNNTTQFTVHAGAQIAGLAGAMSYDGTWKHVAVTVSSAGLVTHYLNGAVSGTPASTGAPTGITTTNSLCIGNRAGTGTCNTDRTFGGSLDDIRIYSQVLNASDISKLYAEAMTKHFLAEAES